MNDPDVKTAMRVLRALPKDDSWERFDAVLALHTLVWDLWQLRDELARR